LGDNIGDVASSLAATSNARLHKSMTTAMHGQNRLP